LINDSIVDVDVKSDPLENKLKVVTKLRSSGSEIDIPLSFLSDGTVKWLSLVTAIITSRSIFAIEEPENFLHPRMQEEIVNIVRSVFAEAKDDRFAIMTTHSETLLNSLTPEELIITYMEDGKTIARAPTNSQEVYDEIRRTGFGLGFYYISGAVE
jgi:predicted ATPase